VAAPWRRHVAALPGADVERRAGYDRDPGGGVEEAVGERVVLEAGDARGRAAALAREHVVPLEDLVEDDPVDEAAEPDAQEQRWEERDHP
jgi:hypothetical protein